MRQTSFECYINSYSKDAEFIDIHLKENSINPPTVAKDPQVGYNL